MTLSTRDDLNHQFRRTPNHFFGAGQNTDHKDLQVSECTQFIHLLYSSQNPILLQTFYASPRGTLYKLPAYDDTPPTTTLTWGAGLGSYRHHSIRKHPLKQKPIMCGTQEEGFRTFLAED